MRGIVGVIAQRNSVAILIDGLKRLEYGGYDPDGIVVYDTSQKPRQCRG